ncbi:hypothetical protein GQ54DRAFT_95681 [Martensiomyces pterosporus]|nr:hypothetical protein GQ54DRAFT_95681 [Martensiomyces pterosporus]
MDSNKPGLRVDRVEAVLFGQGCQLILMLCAIEVFICPNSWAVARARAKKGVCVCVCVCVCGSLQRSLSCSSLAHNATAAANLSAYACKQTTILYHPHPHPLSATCVEIHWRALDTCATVFYCAKMPPHEWVAVCSQI